jgi:hypothetical protein
MVGPTPESAAEEAGLVYDARFRAEVEQALREADSPDAKWLSEDEVSVLREARWASWRAAKTQRM